VDEVSRGCKIEGLVSGEGGGGTNKGFGRKGGGKVHIPQLGGLIKAEWMRDWASREQGEQSIRG